MFYFCSIFERIIKENIIYVLYFFLVSATEKPLGRTWI